MNFTDFEKRIIKKITETKPEDAFIFGYITSEFFKPKQLALFLLHQYKSYNLFHKTKNISDIKVEYARISQLLSLLQYLETNHYIDILPITPSSDSVDLFYKDKGNVYIDKQNSRFYIDQTEDRYITIPHGSEKESFLIDCGEPVM